jgi:apolipoprotein N-acyltransferase
MSLSRRGLARLLAPWRQPAPWLALLLLAIATISSPPRLWFWLALLLVVLLVGWLQALRAPRD